MWLAHTLPFLSTLVDFILTYLKLALHMAIKPGLQYSKVLHPVLSVPGKTSTLWNTSVQKKVLKENEAYWHIVGQLSTLI